MKNLKKSFAIVLTVAMLATLFMVPVLAEEQTPAEKLETLGILVGSGSGVTEEYLASPATKITSAILLLKLKGLIGEAEMWAGTDNFDDADQAQSIYAGKIMGYLFENPDLGFVGYMGKLDPNAVISAQMYYKVLLTALGYEQGVDFEWAGVIEFAESLGMTAIADVTELTIADFATATVEALNTEVKGTGMTLIEKLVDDGVIAVEDAEAAGWDFTPVIESAAQTSINTIDVTFSMAVDDSAAVIKLKQGVVIWYATVAWNAEKTVATLTTAASPLPAGTYTVEVTGLEETMTADVTVAAAVATSMAITTDIIYASTTDIAYAIYDQFGDAIAVGPAVATIYNQTDAVAIAPGSVGNTYVFFAAQTVGDVVKFTLTYMGITVSKTFTVQADPAASSIAFGTIAPLAGDAYIFAGKAGYVIPYTLYDQYGVAALLPMDATAASMSVGGTDNFIFVSSNTAVVDTATFAVDGSGVLTFTAGAAGTALITAIWNANVVGQLSITVNALSTPTSAVIAAPSALIAAGEGVSLDMVITDQYGTVLDNSAAAVTVEATNCAAVINATTDKLDISATVAGTATVNIKVGTTVIGTVSFTVYPAAVAASVTGISIPTIYENNSTYVIAIASVSVLDQYGRAFTPTSIALSEVSDASSAISVGGNTIWAHASNVGTASLKVTADGVALASYTFSVQVIAAGSITAYTLAPMGPIQVSTNPAYFATPMLLGVMGTSEVVLADPYDYDSLSTSNGAVAMPYGTDKVQGVSAGTATISAWKGGAIKASGTVTVVNETLVATTVTIDAAALTTATVASVVTVFDQYGVEIAAVGTYFLDGVAVAGTTTFDTADTYTVAFLTSNGVYKAGDVVVTTPPV